MYYPSFKLAPSGAKGRGALEAYGWGVAIGKGTECSILKSLRYDERIQVEEDGVGIDWSTGGEDS